MTYNQEQMKHENKLRSWYMQAFFQILKHMREYRATMDEEILRNPSSGIT